jgi:hypothetical protein
LSRRSPFLMVSWYRALFASALHTYTGRGTAVNREKQP